jgi:hypothetical protein
MSGLSIQCSDILSSHKGHAETPGDDENRSEHELKERKSSIYISLTMNGLSLVRHVEIEH